MQKQVIALYVDRTYQQWIVRDPEGNFWILPPSDNAWERRQPYQLEENSQLEPIPGHYKYMLELPF